MRLSVFFFLKRGLQRSSWLSKAVTGSEEAYRGWGPELPQEAGPPRTPICPLICTGEAAALAERGKPVFHTECVHEPGTRRRCRAGTGFGGTQPGTIQSHSQLTPGGGRRDGESWKAWETCLLNWLLKNPVGRGVLKGPAHTHGPIKEDGVLDKRFKVAEPEDILRVGEEKWGCKSWQSSYIASGISDLFWGTVGSCTSISYVGKWHDLICYFRDKTRNNQSDPSHLPSLIKFVVRLARPLSSRLPEQSAVCPSYLSGTWSQQPLVGAELVETG